MTENNIPTHSEIPEPSETMTPPPEFGETGTPPIQVPAQRVAVRLPTRQPLVTYLILGITILIYLLQMGSQYLLGYDLPAAMGMKINEQIVTGELWRLFTPMLLHGSILHIGFNMYALYILGRELERHFGHWQFLALYVASGFAGVVVSFVLTAAPSLGASTAIFGLLGAQGVFAYKNQKVFGARARRALSSIINIALVNFLIGLSPMIDNWGHFGGLVGGVLVAWFGGPEYRLEGEVPNLSLENQHDDRALLLAVLGTGLLFGLLTAGIILVRGT